MISSYKDYITSFNRDGNGTIIHPLHYDKANWNRFSSNDMLKELKSYHIEERIQFFIGYLSSKLYENYHENMHNRYTLYISFFYENQGQIVLYSQEIINLNIKQKEFIATRVIDLKAISRILDFIVNIQIIKS